MEKEINAGYIITDRLTVGNSEFVVGQRDTEIAPFVTWKCRKDQKGYFWGHYLSDRLTALEDLCNRALDEVHYLRSLQQEKDATEKKEPKFQKKKHGQER
jgi:hypothetical protein